MRRVRSLVALAFLPFLAAACQPAAAEPAVIADVHAAAVPPPVVPPAPVDVVPERLPRPLVSPVTAEVQRALEAIWANDPSLAANVFAKMGGSSVVNRGFLHCFDEREEIDLAGRDALSPTLEFFRAGRINTKSPFGRPSLAAAVGWSIRHGMGGRPSYVAQELRATRARWALAFFGSNDVMGRNAHQFLARLDRLVSVISETGAVPVLGATYPRVSRDAPMNEQVRRYNRLSSALAQAMGLPYIDFHQAMLPLPVRGLAADGYHPNSYTIGPRTRACDFTEEGLRYGNNQRNLLTLTALDALRRVVIEHEAPAPSLPVSPGDGTRVSPVRIRALPFAVRLPVTRFAEQSGGSICSTGSLVGPRHVAKLKFDAPTRVRISAVQMGALEMHFEVVAPDGSCLGGATDDEVITLPAGVSEIAVVAVTPRRPPEEASGEPRTLFVVDVEP
jgi:hypothetical protein